MTYIDSNVLIDLIEDDPLWGQWSEDELQRALNAGPVAITPVGYAEIVGSFRSIETLDNFLRDTHVEVRNLTRAASFLAGGAHMLYRRRKGNKFGVLADFFIGAQASTEGATLLTRDATRYRSYFPTLQLIAPN